MAQMESQKDIIQYVPFMSFVHPSFWHNLTEIKLEIDKLNETRKRLYGRYTYRSDIGPVFEVDGTSFNKSPESEHYQINISGTLLNKNTIEEFKNVDKADLLNTLGRGLWTHNNKKLWVANPNLLLNFFVLSFADLKKFHYYYWFAFPTPSQPAMFVNEKSTDIKKHLNSNQIHDLAEGFKALPEAQKCFFVIVKEDGIVKVQTLADILNTLDPTGFKNHVNMANVYFVFADPSNNHNPGWPLRILLAVLLDHCPTLANTDVRVIGLRCNATGEIDNSLLFNIRMSELVEIGMDRVAWVGWEKNEKLNFGPRLANMSATMDPVKLAAQFSDLNIKLMKWRLVPEIDIEVMKSTKCLLLGAGTLGCQVARNLLAWGFRDITFIDNGIVSYSNPSRQVLFNFQDCLAGGRKKAEAAAENLKAILPTVNSKGITAHIPMPGHPIGETLLDETIANIKLLTEAIAEHDVIFLLLDTREARWLPTLLAAHYGKIVVNAALGFDSYLVMRHGIHTSSEDGASVESTSIENTQISGGNLGCYFCNDVTAPGNSLKDRTLDQQCTVTRPGVAAIAGALAVEMLVGLLQHPLRGEAPAIYNSKNDIGDPPEGTQGALGPIPHSIRGFLSFYQTVLPTCTKFKQCIACSDVVLKFYRKEGLKFLLDVFNSGFLLEHITGLTELQLSAQLSDILTLSDDEE